MAKGPISSTYDLDQLQKLMSSHEVTFRHVPKFWEKWATKVPPWQQAVFKKGKSGLIPDKAGLYTFILQPGVANHVANSYLLYVGISNNLRVRYRSYLGELNKTSKKTTRPFIWLMIKRWHRYLSFVYIVLPKSTNKTREELEMKFIEILNPPVNREMPAKILAARKAF
jgi:hypothetical protein